MVTENMLTAKGQDSGESVGPPGVFPGQPEQHLPPSPSASQNHDGDQAFEI